jgi:hypothetical protein
VISTKIGLKHKFQRVRIESAKSLGPSAYLVNVLPSLVLVLTVFVLVSSRLYPWEHPWHDGKGRLIPPGLASVAHTVQELKVAGAVVLLFVVLLVAITFRPFQVAAVQFLEGYWRRGALDGLAVELHARRLSASLSRSTMTPWSSGSTDFTTVARDSRHARRIAQMSSRAGRVAESYPEAAADLLPTSLGNILRRAETSAGERYGLGTVITYPRLYPYVSARLSAEMAMQLDPSHILAPSSRTTTSPSRACTRPLGTPEQPIGRARPGLIVTCYPFQGKQT